MRNTTLAAWLLALSIGCGSTPPAQLVPPVTTATPSALASVPPSATTATPPIPTPPHGPDFPPGWSFPAGSTPVTSAKGMVSTDAELATKVGAAVLAEGGNAVDAAVATAFALAVVHPTAGNIGGGGFMVARVDGAPHALDFRETAPAAATRDMYLGRDGKANGLSKSGHKASGVPGSVAGLWEAHQKLGSKKKTWAELLAPAIKLAEEGFVVSEGFAHSVSEQADRLKKFAGSAALFYPGGAAIAAGSTWKNPDLAKTLKLIAAQGPKGFYEGPVAKAIADEMRRGGGLVTQADLKAYKAKWRTPLLFDYHGKHLLTMPPPSSGGLTLAMIGHVLDGYDLKKYAWHSPEHVHFVAEAMRRAFVSRNAKLGDPDFVRNPTDELMSEEWAKAQRATIKDDRATPTSELAPQPASGGAGPHTTHFSVIDDQGNAVALTTTINWWFGSGVTVAGAGFVMNNEMDDFATIPGTANGFGLVQGEPNAIAPGKRMLSSMAPTVVVGEGGKVELALGAAGGPRIITAVFQELSNVVDFGFDLTTAVNAPRFHQQDFPDVLGLEKGGSSEELRRKLGAMGYTIKEMEHLADAPGVGRDGDHFVGAPEPRRKGSFAAGP